MTREKRILEIKWKLIFTCILEFLLVAAVVAIEEILLRPIMAITCHLFPSILTHMADNPKKA